MQCIHTLIPSSLLMITIEALLLLLVFVEILYRLISLFHMYKSMHSPQIVIQLKETNESKKKENLENNQELEGDDPELTALCN